MDDALFLVFNGGESGQFVLPDPPEGAAWARVLDTATATGEPDTVEEAGATALIREESIAVFALVGTAP